MSFSYFVYLLVIADFLPDFFSTLRETSFSQKNKRNHKALQQITWLLSSGSALKGLGTGCIKKWKKSFRYSPPKKSIFGFRESSFKFLSVVSDLQVLPQLGRRRNEDRQENCLLQRQTARHQFWKTRPENSSIFVFFSPKRAHPLIPHMKPPHSPLPTRSQNKFIWLHVYHSLRAPPQPTAQSHLWPWSADTTGGCWELLGWETGGHMGVCCMWWWW